MAKKGKKPNRRPAPRRGSRALVVALVVLVAAAAGYYFLMEYQSRNELGVAETVTIETSKGTFVMEVYPDLVPTTANNFLNLARTGFYDGLIWHRVEDWVVQTGDPTGTGMGGSDQTIPLEINRKLSNLRGAVGMARSQDPNSASSQFYILRQDAVGLDGNYAVFGRVVEGMEVIDQLAVGDTMLKVTVAQATGDPD